VLASAVAMAIVPGATESRAQPSVAGEAAEPDSSSIEPAAAVALDAAVSVAPVVGPIAPAAVPPTTMVKALPLTIMPGPGDPFADIRAIPTPVPLAVGVSEGQLAAGGFTRTFVTVLPPPSAKQRSLLIVLHGVNGRGANMRAMGFEPGAAANGTVVVYPDAIGGSWNDGRVGMEPMQTGMVTDDIAFLRALIDEMAARANVDPARVAVAGFSNGAMMANRVACDLSDRVRGVALVAGTAGQNLPQTCRPARSVPLVEVHGTSDPVVPYSGGKVAENQGRKRGSAISVTDFVSFWSNTGHCSGARETPIKAALAVTLIEAQACTSGSPIVHYRVTGGTHDWFRIQGFDTTKAVWDFLTVNSL
jgi:polyhydroxybutyrate depolymerase